MRLAGLIALCCASTAFAQPQVWRIRSLDGSFDIDPEAPLQYVELAARAEPASHRPLRERGPSRDEPTPMTEVGPLESGAPMTITVVGRRGARVLHLGTRRTLGHCWAGNHQCTDFHEIAPLPADVRPLIPEFAVEGEHPILLSEGFRSHATPLGSGDSESCAGSTSALARSIGAQAGTLFVICFDDGLVAITHVAPDQSARTIMRRGSTEVAQLPGACQGALREGNVRQAIMRDGDRMRLVPLR